MCCSDLHGYLRRMNSNNNNYYYSSQKIWNLKTHDWILVIFLTLLSMAQSGSTGNCDNLLEKFTPYPCRQIKRSPQDQTFGCTVFNKLYCDRYANQTQPEEFPESDLKLEYINIYNYTFNRSPYKGVLNPTLNLSLSLPKGEALMHTNAIRLDVWSNSLKAYQFPGICRLLKFSNVHFNPGSKLALLNHNCFWIPDMNVNMYVIEISLYPSTQKIAYNVKIVDNRKIVLAVAAIFPQGTIHAVLGISPTSKEILKLFRLTNLDTLNNVTKYTAENSIVFTKLDSGKYQITVYSDEFGPENGFQFPVVDIKRHPKRLSLSTIAVTVFLLVFLLLIFALLLICLRFRQHIKFMFVDLKIPCNVVLVTFHQNSHDKHVTDQLRNVFENNFKWSVINLDTSALSNLGIYLTSNLKIVLFIMPFQWSCIAESREMAANYFHTSFSVNPSLLAVLYQQNKTVIPKCLQELPKFHITKNIKKIFELVYAASIQLNGYDKCLSLHRMSLSPIFRQQIHKYPNWMKLKESLEGKLKFFLFSDSKQEVTVVFESRPI